MTWSYEAVLKASLTILSAISFTVNCTPPNGPPPSLPPRPPLKSLLSSRMREWTLVFATLYLYPSAVKLYWLASLNEAVYILRTVPAGHISSLFLLSAILSISGGTIRYLAYRTLADGFTYELVPAGERSRGSSKSKLVTHGPYSVVRHPSYIGMALATLGCAMVHLVGGSWIRSGCSGSTQLVSWAFVGVWMLIMSTVNVLLVIRVGEEDEMMQKQFGEEWERWKRRVKYKLVPSVY